MAGPKGRFISEPITPAPGQFDISNMSRGEPGIPMRFSWRKTEYVVEDVLDTWKGHQWDGHTAGTEMYLKKHWYTVKTTTGEEMTIYCDRQPRGRNKKQRWWLHTMKDTVD